MIIAVTGAGGFIGSALVPALSAAGYPVISLVRIGKGKGSALGRVKEIDVVTGEGLAQGFEGVDTVVHLAGRTPAIRENRGDAAEYQKANAAGTRNVVRAALSAGVKTFIHLSSIKAMGESSDRILTEADKCEPETPYGASKLGSENVVAMETGAAGAKGVILRLPMVYGPGNKGNILRMLHWADRGYPFPIFPPESLRSMIYVGNVVSGVMSVLRSAPVTGAAGATYILKDDKDYSSRMIYTVMCRAFGKSPRFLTLPKALSRFGCMFSGDLRRMTEPFRVGSGKISGELGYSPPFDLETGIAETVRWYRCLDR